MTELPQAVLTALAPLRHHVDGLLVALDFDGTLAPIVEDPELSRPVAGVAASLVALARGGARVAVVTGRDAETALRLSGFGDLPGLVVSGLHGAETWRAGHLDTREEPPGIQTLRQSLPPVLAGTDDKVWLEDKRLSLVVHTRRTSDPQATLEALRAPVTAMAREAGLDVLPGHMVLEIRIPSLSKADALAALVTERTSAMLVAGDDHGDLAGFTFAHDWAARTGRPCVAVGVGGLGEVLDAADVTVPDPVAMAAVLAALAAPA